MSRWLAAVTLAGVLATAATPAQQASLPRLLALPGLDIAAYMGTWHQVAWIPNRFLEEMWLCHFP